MNLREINVERWAIRYARIALRRRRSALTYTPVRAWALDHP